MWICLLLLSLLSCIDRTHPFCPAVNCSTRSNMDTEIKRSIQLLFEESGRDDSHGLCHAEAVAANSEIILSKLAGSTGSIAADELPQMGKLVASVALLHDVSDHKYDPEGKMMGKMREILSSFFSSEEVQLVMDIIERMSYSKENKAILKGLPLDWEEKLGPQGCLVRDIVSDADKLEAIGLIGVERCLEYTKETNPGFDERQCVEQLVAHSKEKLFRLKDEFIRTAPGKELAAPLHEEM
ncbi:hypothetical protein B484DRAFT_347321, partial [Ochromonadaceae sp. CCMP2298]